MSAWKKGPLPPGTWQWGAVVLKGESSMGFYFADFCGDHAKILRRDAYETIKAADVGFYNNSLTLPIRVDDEEICGTRLGPQA